MPRICKAMLICVHCGDPLRRKTSVPDASGRWFCGEHCRRKYLRDEQKRARWQHRRQAAGVAPAAFEVGNQETIGSSSHEGAKCA